MRRYPFGKASYDAAQLHAEVLAAGLPCAGVCGSLDVVEVLLDDTAPADALARLVPIVAAHAPDPDRPARQKRAAAVGALMSADDPISVALRAFIRDLYTRHNDLRERLGLPRQQEPEIVGRVIAGIGGGLGDPPA